MDITTVIYHPYIQDLDRLKNHLNNVDTEPIPQAHSLSEFESGAVPEIPTEAKAIETAAEAKVDPANLPSQRLTLLSEQEKRDKEIHSLIKKGYKAELEKERKKTVAIDTSPPVKRKKRSTGKTVSKPKSQKRSVYDIFTL